jgi:hypothetical protein
MPYIEYQNVFVQLRIVRTINKVFPDLILSPVTLTFSQKKFYHKKYYNLKIKKCQQSYTIVMDSIQMKIAILLNF